MQKIVFTIFLLIAAGNFGCGTTGLMQNQNVAGVQPTLATSPTPPTTGKGEHSSGLKDYNGVINCYREILRRNPEETNAQYGLAQVLVEDLKDYDEGLKEALIAQDKKASYTWAISELLGKAYEGKGDIPNALKQYKQYLRDFRGMKDTDSTLYKDMQKKVAELEKTLKTSNQNSNNNQKTQ